MDAWSNKFINKIISEPRFISSNFPKNFSTPISKRPHLQILTPAYLEIKNRIPSFNSTEDEWIVRLRYVIPKQNFFNHQITILSIFLDLILLIFIWSLQDRSPLVEIRIKTQTWSRGIETNQNWPIKIDPISRSALQIPIYLLMIEAL